MTALCRHCGKTEDRHCSFEALEMPPGCVCDPKLWTDGAPPICAEYVDVGNGTQYCRTCEHDEGCHK